MGAELRAARKEIARLKKALLFYADPDSYYACSFLFDPPCGQFRDDFCRDFWTRKLGYDRRMPGKHARRALKRYILEEASVPEVKL